MKSFVKWNLVILVLAVGLACASGAYADTFDWTFSGGGVTASGTLTGTPIGGGVYDLTGGTILVSGATENGSGVLVPINPSQGIPSTNHQNNDPFYTLPGDTGGIDFTYDDQLTLAPNQQLSGNGLLFAIGGYGINLWGNSSSNYEFFQGFYQVDAQGSFTATPVSTPEPSVVSLLTLGLIG